MVGNDSTMETEIDMIPLNFKGARQALSYSTSMYQIQFKSDGAMV